MPPQLHHLHSYSPVIGCKVVDLIWNTLCTTPQMIHPSCPLFFHKLLNGKVFNLQAGGGVLYLFLRSCSSIQTPNKLHHEGHLAVLLCSFLCFRDLKATLGHTHGGGETSPPPAVSGSVRSRGRKRRGRQANKCHRGGLKPGHGETPTGSPVCSINSQPQQKTD